MKRKRVLNWGRGTVLLAAALLCSACTALFGPNDRLPPELPDAYRSDSGAAPLAADWWTAFGDEQLDRVVARALSGNLTIEQAAARLRQAEAAARKSGAGRWPSLTGSGEGGTTYTHTDALGTVTADRFELGLVANYELDLWGRVAATHRSARHDLEGSRFNLQTAAMTISAQTAIQYFQWQLSRHRLAVLEQQLETNRKMLSVIEERFQTSQADALAVLQQRRRVAAAEAAIPPVEAALSAAGNALAVLVGVAPQTDLQLAVNPLPELPDRPNAGLPADLLARRPDLQAAWEQLAAADWDLSAARANRMPAIKMTGRAAYGDDSMEGLFDNWIKNLTAGLTLPLIDGGSLRAEAARARAVAEERLAAYRETVISALSEVEDALVAENSQMKYLELLDRQLAVAQTASDEAFRRYTRGLSTFFEALSEETTRQSLEVSLLQARYDLLAGRVRLCRALGGDWSSVLANYRQEDTE